MERPNHSKDDEKKIQSLEKEINSFHEKLINVENQKKKVILDRIKALCKIFDNGNNHSINFFLKIYIEKAKEFGVDPSEYSEIEQELLELEKEVAEKYLKKGYYPSEVLEEAKAQEIIDNLSDNYKKVADYYLNLKNSPKVALEHVQALKEINNLIDQEQKEKALKALNKGMAPLYALRFSRGISFDNVVLWGGE